MSCQHCTTLIPLLEKRKSVSRLSCRVCKHVITFDDQGKAVYAPLPADGRLSPPTREEKYQQTSAAV